MLFNSLPFLGFFCVVFVVYWALPGRRFRLLWLLSASVYFYMSWNPWLVGLILFSASIDFLAAVQMERLPQPWQRRLLLFVSVSMNVGLLLFFKYVNFFLASAYSLQEWFGGEPNQRFLDIVLPLGISFYTFETISYISEVYQRRIRAVRDPLAYALYIFFFPHLVAGPIVRPHHFLPQLQRLHRFNWDRLQLGVQFFLLGLFKKSVLADNLAAIIDPYFAAPHLYGSAASWFAVLAYSAQIYLDFSGYSDMAVGLAHMLGYHLPANFARPYLAASLPEFWRRWHISLSSWLRDYLFIPLGGSRCGRVKTCRNLFVTMLLGGLWHGANWTFVVWGAFHGVLLAVHRGLPRGRWRESAVARPLAIGCTFLLVCIGWVFFRAQSLTDAGAILGRLFWPTRGNTLPMEQQATIATVLAVLAAGHLLGASGKLERRERFRPAGVVGAGLAGLLLLIMLLAPENGKAFLYFQF